MRRGHALIAVILALILALLTCAVYAGSEDGTGSQGQSSEPESSIEAASTSEDESSTEAAGTSVDPGNAGEEQTEEDPGKTPSQEPAKEPSKEPAKKPVHKHKWSKWKITKKATYFTKGRKKRTCSCGKSETKVIPKVKAVNKWVTDSKGRRYYAGSKGKLLKGWRLVPGSNREGADAKWCYFASKSGVLKKKVSGTIQNKWVDVGSRRYYFTDKSRLIGKGFRMIDDKLYYFRDDRSLVRGRFKTEDGETYRTEEDGSITGRPYYVQKYRTLIYVDISEQKMWYYSGRKLKYSAGVVTGLKGRHETPRGSYYIRRKATGVWLVGPTWSSYVSYWMPFVGNSIGFHDATWRSDSDFSKPSTYKNNGSHGCINMKKSAAKWLFDHISVGTRVLIVD